MITNVENEMRYVTVEDVEYVPGFTRNLSHVNLEKKSIRLSYAGTKRYLTSKCGTRIVEVKSGGDILVVRGDLSGALANANLVCSVVENQEHVSEALHEDTLYKWHKRFGHQSYDASKALAAKPITGKLTDRERPTCITCAEGKQTKNRLSKKDSGERAPTDGVGRVICSNLKPITPADREKNRYLVNFIVYKTNYCRICLARTKDEAEVAKKFLHFVGHFERRFDCRVQLLRTYGGGEYKNIDLFCERSGIARQRTEADNIED
jgi:hypothetical protein